MKVHRHHSGGWYIMMLRAASYSTRHDYLWLYLFLNPVQAHLKDRLLVTTLQSLQPAEQTMFAQRSVMGYRMIKPLNWACTAREAHNLLKMRETSESFCLLDKVPRLPRLGRLSSQVTLSRSDMLNPPPEPGHLPQSLSHFASKVSTCRQGFPTRPASWSHGDIPSPSPR